MTGLKTDQENEVSSVQYASMAANPSCHQCGLYARPWTDLQLYLRVVRVIDLIAFVPYSVPWPWT